MPDAVIHLDTHYRSINDPDGRTFRVPIRQNAQIRSTEPRTGRFDCRIASARPRLPRPQTSHQNLPRRLPGNPGKNSRACVDFIFADPPYFLSNNGITCHAGRMVSVNKGDWDRSRGVDANHEFNRAWLAACQRVLKPNGTIWVSGTSHVIHSVGFAMQQLEFKLLNDISWVKPNPPPNLSCRYFTHATETIIWAAKNKKSRHAFNYKLMKETNHGKQMKSVWEVLPPTREEKLFGKHPAQKPVALLERIILASSNEGDLVLDPFMGSGTTLVSALRLRRSAYGCEFEFQSISLSLRRMCSELVQVEISAICIQIDLDPHRDLWIDQDR